VHDLRTPEGWKAELTLAAGYILRWFTCPRWSDTTRYRYATPPTLYVCLYAMYAAVRLCAHCTPVYPGV